MRPLMVAVAVLLPASASGYSAPALFDVGPSLDSTGGSGGIYYTGSPRFQGQGCEGCHTGGEGQVDLGLKSIPAGLFDGEYEAGALYHIEVAFSADQVGATECPDDPARTEACNLNLFALEVLDLDHQPLGELCPTPFQDGDCPHTLGAPTTRSADGTTLFASGLKFGSDGMPGFREGRIAYDLYWQAPSWSARDGDADADAQGLGTADFWISAVDGDGGRDTEGHPSDPSGDLTGTFRIPIRGPARVSSVAGCAVGAATPGGPTMGPLARMAFGLLLAARRGRR